ncbi:YggS family pyridoxal phosphate-dependent enzyme [bacterium]|nr:YggS family pyridoxal phosphate-dependent enzyme [bacterium]
MTLIAVSKTHSSDIIRIVLSTGHRTFGENRIQESTEKWTQLKAEYPDVKLHFIGPFQINKIKKIIELFDVIHSIDRLKLVELLSREMDNTEHFPECIIQVNTGEEAQKSGVLPQEADSFIDTCITKFNLPVTGVKCVPPVNSAPEPHFNLLRQIAKRHSLPVISMGMSRDYKTAIQYGATHVRVGDSIFGQRKV